MSSVDLKGGELKLDTHGIGVELGERMRTETEQTIGKMLGRLAIRVCGVKLTITAQEAPTSAPRKFVCDVHLTLGKQAPITLRGSGYGQYAAVAGATRQARHVLLGRARHVLLRQPHVLLCGPALAAGNIETTR